MLQKIIYLLVLVAVISGLVLTFTFNKSKDVPPLACTMEAMICPDGSAVGRTGPNCEFAACPTPVSQDVPGDLNQYLASKADLIKVATPTPFAKIKSPLNLSGEARGYWFFEASFPVTLVNWDGLIIAEGVATAEGEWMTEEFVPFTAELEFNTNFATDTPAFMKKGAIILKKDNPSGMPENDNALEIPIVFE
jgi:hypothetical protein